MLLLDVPTIRSERAVKHVRNRIATTVLVAALGMVGAACEADGVDSPGQEGGVTDVEETGDTGAGEDEGGLGY